MICCPTCRKNVSHHAYSVCCNLCNNVYHLKCITLNQSEIDEIISSRESWYCSTCISCLFPFNSIDSDIEFRATIEGRSDHCLVSDKILMPLSLNDSELFHNHNHCDPDSNFFNEFCLDNGNSCKYYLEDNFKAALTNFLAKETLSLSLCHTNIRSCKANLTSFESYLETLEFSFQIIGLSETWVQDYSESLYGIKDYYTVEGYRKDKKGGGVAILIYETINFSRRQDLEIFNEFLSRFLLK